MLLKIKPGKRAVWEAWCSELMSRAGEVRITLEEEDLVRESCRIFGEGDESYLVYRHEPKDGVEKKPANLDRELNRKHFQKFAECLEVISKVSQVGYDIST